MAQLAGVYKMMKTRKGAHKRLSGTGSSRGGSPAILGLRWRLDGDRAAPLTLLRLRLPSFSAGAAATDLEA